VDTVTLGAVQFDEFAPGENVPKLAPGAGDELGVHVCHVTLWGALLLLVQWTIVPDFTVTGLWNAYPIGADELFETAMDAVGVVDELLFVLFVLLVLLGDDPPLEPEQPAASKPAIIPAAQMLTNVVTTFLVIRVLPCQCVGNLLPEPQNHGAQMYDCYVPIFQDIYVKMREVYCLTFSRLKRWKQSK